MLASRILCHRLLKTNGIQNVHTRIYYTLAESKDKNILYTFSRVKNIEITRRPANSSGSLR